MKIFCDANIGSIIASALVEAGHDVVRAVHVTPDAPDRVILAYAVAEQRLLITCDSDFGDLIFFRGHAPPIGVVYVRFEPQDVRDVVPRLIAVLATDDANDHMTVIDEIHIRRRPFPEKSEDHG